MSSPAPGQHHAVQFYGNDSTLFETVSGFLAQGLVEGNPAMLIATPAHTKSILDRLKSRLIDVERAQRSGSLTVFDAQRTLNLFMVGDMPDERAFEEHIGRAVRSVLRNHTDRTLIRAYGEMVDVLWKQGRIKATIRLEMLWNTLAHRYGFALLCGYAIGNFDQSPGAFEEVCRQHTHIVPADAPFGTRSNSGTLLQ